MATIGADPEFALVRGDRVVSAREFFRNLVSATYPFGNVGMDGAGGPMEVRPKPSFKPNDVVANIGRLLSEARILLPDTVQICVGAYADGIGGIGGHLHTWGRGGTRGKLEGNYNKGRICIGLSILWLLEHPDAGHQRRRAGYGGINDTRRGEPAHEFRSPSADWLASPSLAQATLSYFQSLVDRVDDYGQDKDECNDILEVATRYWQAPPSENLRGAYTDRLLRFVGNVARPKDLSVLMFYAERLSRLREAHGLVRLDIDKWRRKTGCAD